MTHSLGLFLLRAGTSFLMIPHGWAKYERLSHALAADEPVKFMDFLGLGTTVSLALTIFGELIAPALILVGFKTRWMAAPAAFTMLVAAFVAHGSDPLADKEHALLYALAFLAVLLLGPGRWSVDTWLSERKS
ncbi:MAG: DoxX family protein [Bacteroidetes bacterium]|jgi:putative oxidoreductase|nr:DoxX family protein [Bacteroidota bacterium]